MVTPEKVHGIIAGDGTADKSIDNDGLKVLYFLPDQYQEINMVIFTLFRSRFRRQ